MLTVTSSITINSASWGRASDISSDGTSPKGSTETREVFYDSLPYFKACLFATVLEDTMTQLRILEECNNETRITKVMSDMPKLLAEKFSVPKKAITDELDEINPKKLDCEEYQLDKLQNDRNFLMKVLSETYLDLSKHRCCVSLTNHVNRVVRSHQHLQNLIKEEANNRILRRELYRQLRQQRNHIKSVTYDSNMVVDNLRSKVEDAALDVEIRGRYIQGWQNARCEQNIQKITDKEKPYVDTIEYYKQKTEQEHRVHSEIELLISIFINETLEKIEKWMVRYEKEMESIDLKIQITKNKYEDTEQRRIDLEEKLKVHEEEIKNWVSFKDQREADRLYREKMNKAATIVQAWWRGLLVRYELGPYKPVKKRPTAKQDKDKKKKK